ncbi:MAG TPA: metal-dependent transcriptional regulator [Thermotogaceae bacterium]|nr:metal-dependent transcriptional regulator [Thermotogaceae bacterium]
MEVFKMTGRRKSLTPALEDYLKAIQKITEIQPVARVSIIAKKMGVSLPSVTNAMKRLRDLGYIEYEKYGLIQLTEKGKQRAKELEKIHSEILDFFSEIIGIPEHISEKISCQIEHFIDSRIQERFERFVNIIKKVPEEGCDKLYKFLSENK